MTERTAHPTPALDVDTAARLRTAIGRLARRLRSPASARETGLSPTSISVLLNVVRHGPSTLSELAASEGINPTMLSRAVAGLVEQGLLERSSDNADRRVAWVRDTAGGRRLAERIRRERTEAVNQAMTGLSQRERQTIEQALPALEVLADQLKERRP